MIVPGIYKGSVIGICYGKIYKQDRVKARRESGMQEGASPGGVVSDLVFRVEDGARMASSAPDTSLLF